MMHGEIVLNEEIEQLGGLKEQKPPTAEHLFILSSLMSSPSDSPLFESSSRRFQLLQEVIAFFFDCLLF